MGRKPLDFEKVPYWLYLPKDVYELLKKLKKEKKIPISEAIREGIILFLQQQGYLPHQKTEHIPSQAMAMGRGFSSGNITHVGNQTQNQVQNPQNPNEKILSFLGDLDYHRMLENLQWARRKLVEAYRKARAYYNELEQMSTMTSGLSIEPQKRHLSEKINECNRFLNIIANISNDFVNKRYPMPEEAVNHIQQLYKLVLELKDEAKRKGWLIEEIVYRDWGRRRKTTPIGAM